MPRTTRRLLITGASGQLGSYLLREACARDIPTVAWSRRPAVTTFDCDCQSVDLREVDTVVAAFREARPDLVIHAAALSSIGACFENAMEARQTNTTATRLVAELAERGGVRMVYISTDLVFDGEAQWYREDACPAPLSVYGRTKVAAERCVLGHARQLVLRLSLLFGPSINGRESFFDQQLNALRTAAPCRLFADEWRTPLSLLAAARAVLTAADSGATGLLHLGGPERMSRLEMGTRLANVMGADASRISAINRCDVESPEPRPRDTSLCCDLWKHTFPDVSSPSFEDALRAMGIGPE